MRLFTRVIFLALGLITGTVLMAQNVHPHYIDGAIFVKLKSTSTWKLGSVSEIRRQKSPAPVAELIQEYKVQDVKLAAPTIHDDYFDRVYRIDFADQSRVKEFMADLEHISEVEFAERVPLYRIIYTPNDQFYGATNQSYLQLIKANLAWDLHKGGNTVVAVVDNAFRRTHQDISPNLWVNPGEIANDGVDNDNNGYIDDINGWDVADDDNNPNPPPANQTGFSHGTIVAGIAAAATDNSVGVASIGFNTEIMCIKATQDTDSSDLITAPAAAMSYAAAAKPDVLNLSYGGPGFSNVMQNLINAINGNGTVIVAAAGNDDVTTVFYPAGYSNVISVAATDDQDKKASFSNYGAWVDISAPGDAIAGPFSSTNSAYVFASGTSMASPVVAGLAALMKSYNPTATVSDIEGCLTSTAIDLDAGNPSYVGQLGAGRIDAFAAMGCIKGEPSANFGADLTSGCAPITVQFTDSSLLSPTSWNWSFPGGTPSSFVGQVPPAVTYSTPGSYDVTLIVSNADGSDTLIRANYITAGNCTPSACDTLSNFNGGTPTVYTSNGWGYVAGHNNFSDNAKAEYVANPSGNGYLSGALFNFAVATDGTGTSTVKFVVWDDDGTSNAPGTVLKSVDIPVAEIISDISNSNYTFVDFDGAVPVNGSFYVGLELVYGVGDTLSLVTNRDPDTNPATAWERWSNGTWVTYDASNGWGLAVAHDIVAFTTDTIPSASITNARTEICEGTTVTFNQTSSQTLNFQWVFPGGNPSTSTDPNPTVQYDSVGTYDAYLIAFGQCLAFTEVVSAEVVTVLGSPDASWTHQPGSQGNSVSFTNTASVDSSSTYIWDFGDGNTGSGANPSHTYANTGQYIVKLIVENACGVDSVSQEIGVYTTSIDQLPGFDAWKVYPNPSQGSFRVVLEDPTEQEVRLRVRNMLGQLIWQKDYRLISGSLEADINLPLSAGTYLLEAEGAEKRTFQRLLINK
ncbi:MAG: S8 family serine peptidase [Bacteroidota bacterium]